MVGITRGRRKKHEPVPIVEVESSEDEIEEIDITEDDISSSLKHPIQHEHKHKRPKLANRKTPEPIVDCNSQWIDKYAPTTVAGISINPTKLKQVRDVLTDMISGSSQCKLLILTGPSGSCKSTTVKLLAQEMIGDRMKSSFDTSSITEFFDTNGVSGTSRATKFEEFLNDARYKVGSNLSVILIEELPNIFHDETLQNFRQAIHRWVFTEATLPPLVLCLTELEYSGTSEKYSFNIENNLTIDTLLGRNITSLPQVQVVKFNAIANRFLKKTMNNIVKQEREIFKKIPTKEIDSFLDDIMKIGDVRSCISNLQLWAMNYVSSLKSNSDTDENKLIDTSKFLVTNFHRENQMNLFHAIGKIIFSSSNFAQFSNQDYLSVEQVLTDFQESNFPLLNLSLLENYTMYKDGSYPLAVASQISNDLSLNDTMSSHMCKEIGIRSTRVNLRTVSSTEKYTHRQKTKFTRHFKMIKQYNKTFNQIRQYQIYINNHKNSFQDLNLIEGYYLPLIYNRQKSTRFRYNRLGGRFREIYADDELPVDDDNQDDMKELDQFQLDIDNRIKQIEQDQVNQEFDDDELSDPISDEETTDEDEFSDDSELDNLISRGQI